VIGEALVAGTPVLASRISGSIGMLGEDYPGFYTFGKTRELAELMRRFEQETRFAAQLRQHCAQRARLFRPRRELAAWRRLLQELGVG
jgi:glycosyltransferase involved in cell wall biosynthesis